MDGVPFVVDQHLCRKLIEAQPHADHEREPQQTSPAANGDQLAGRATCRHAGREGPAPGSAAAHGNGRRGDGSRRRRAVDRLFELAVDVERDDRLRLRSGPSRAPRRSRTARDPSGATARRCASASKIDSMRPGCFFSHSRSIAVTCRRCRCSCEPHRLHGMIGKRHELGVAREIALADVDERPDDDVPAVVGDELRRHRLQLAAEEEVEEERREDVVAVMAERDLRGADLARRRDRARRAAAASRASTSCRLRESRA